jgi:hypothetical protein
VPSGETRASPDGRLRVGLGHFCTLGLSLLCPNEPTRLAADSPLMIGLVPGMIIEDHKGSDHAIAPGEYLGRDPAGGS